MTPRTERFELRLDSETIKQVDRWRAEQSNLPSRSEAVRRLIESGLGTSSRQDFVIMKFQILAASRLSGTHDAISDANVFAWQHNVYPFNDHTQEHWAEPFTAHFQVTKVMITELADFLDKLWLKKKTITFYELEDRYELSRGSTKWNRNGLIDACRYIYLQEMFDEQFWKALLTPMEYPTEAGIIVSPFDREDDVYLG
jgi:antitoxin MazE